ncbi:hypothetical protein FWH58_00375 [Candidatus Saccharibacteria bacterium]|nr:hypothetical protein [Candidatus Saccharibacteria bacterium]
MDETASHTPVQNQQTEPPNAKVKKLQMFAVILIVLAILLGGALVYALVTRDSDNNATNNPTNNNQNSNSQNGNQTNSTTNEEVLGKFSVAFSDAIWTTERKTFADNTGSTAGRPEAVEFRLQANPTIGARLVGPFDSLGDWCPDAEPPTTITKLGTTKNGLAIIQQSKYAYPWLDPGTPAPSGIIYVSRIEFASGSTSKTISCQESLSDWVIDDDIAFLSLNPWSSLSSSEQAALLELMSSLTEK